MWLRAISMSQDRILRLRYDLYMFGHFKFTKNVNVVNYELFFFVQKNLSFVQHIVFLDCSWRLI